MTWLTGSTTWGALSYDLTRLLTGEAASAGTGSNAATLASGDRWLRETTRTVTDGVTNSTTTFTSATAAFTALDVGLYVIAAGIPAATVIASVTNGTTVVLSAAATASASGLTAQICTDTIRTPTSKDVSTGACSARTGYFASLGLTIAPGSLAAGLLTVCRVTAPFTTIQGTGRWAMTIQMLGSNTVAGNYSTASARYSTYDVETGAIIQNNTGMTLNAAGSVSLAGGMTLSLTDPSGTLPSNAIFARAFSMIYPYGVDYWPMYYRSGTAAQAFTVAPPGVAGTDYDVLAQPTFPSGGMNSQSVGAMRERSSLFHGLGIKTATGLGAPGALYTLSHSMALGKCRIFNSATAGVLSLDVGQSKKDTVTTAVMRCIGIRVPAWAKCFTTPGSVTASSAVQYFLQATGDGFVLVLNGDPGVSGKLGTAVYTAITPTEPTYDTFPMVFNATIVDYLTDTQTGDFKIATQYQYYGLRKRQDGSEGARDWQTKWLRAEHLYARDAGMSESDVSGASQNPSSVTALSVAALGWTFGTQGSSTSVDMPVPLRQGKPSLDGKWWLYGFQYGDGSYGSFTSGQDDARMVRGTTTRWFYIPADGWASGDELTDTGSGTKYLLVSPDYAGLQGRARTATSTYIGGLAIPEV